MEVGLESDPQVGIDNISFILKTTFLPVVVVARHTIQAASGSYPRFRVKMFGLSVGVIRDWALSDVQVSMTILVVE